MVLLPDGAYAAALASLPGVGPRKLREWLDDSTPAATWHRICSGERDRRFAGAARATDVEAVWAAHHRAGITVLVRGQSPYPTTLAEDGEAPAVLFALGDPTIVDRFATVAIVGTRTATRYGLGMAAQLGGDLAGGGVAVVSGLALGIDGAAHEGAVAAWGSRGRDGGAPPIAVVAGGLDHPYPRRHALLWRRVAEAGAVLSEAPVGSADLGWRFPQRNRIMAALADVVVVVECHATGGSLYTVRAAVRRGVAVGAVPGSVRSPASAGTNDLLADGCFVVRDATDVRVALGLAHAGRPDRPRRDPARGTLFDDPLGGTPDRPAPDRLGSALVPGDGPTSPIGCGADEDVSRRVLEALEWEPCALEDVLRRTLLDLDVAAEALERLRATGRARGEGGWWERT